MCHLNIRSPPEHFLEFTAYIEHLNIDFKIIALSETWLKPHHIDYIIPSYNIENELRIKRRGGGVCLYIHINSLQYKVRNDQETLNSVFVEIDKNTTNTKCNLIVGCIYQPPWVKILDLITALTDKLEILKREKRTLFLWETIMSTFLHALNLTWEQKNLRILYLLIIFSFLLISQPEKQNPQILL